MNCPECNAEIRETSAFCPKCGTRLPIQRAGTEKKQEPHDARSDSKKAESKFIPAAGINKGTAYGIYAAVLILVLLVPIIGRTVIVQKKSIRDLTHAAKEKTEEHIDKAVKDTVGPVVYDRGTGKAKTRRELEAEIRKELEAEIRAEIQKEDEKNNSKKTNDKKVQNVKTPAVDEGDGFSPESPARPHGLNIAKFSDVAVSGTAGCWNNNCPKPIYVIDGDEKSMGSFWCGSDNAKGTGWVRLTLDKYYLLSKIRVISQYWEEGNWGNNKEGCLKYRVTVSSDGNNWQTVRELDWACKQFSNFTSSAIEEMEFDETVVKYIEVSIAGSTGVKSHAWRTIIREIEAGDEDLPLYDWKR